MQVSILFASSTAITFICRKYEGFVLLVALTEKSALSRVYGNELERVMFTLVFSTGDAELGVMEAAALVSSIKVTDRELDTTRPLTEMVKPRVAPELVLGSKAVVRQTRLVDDVD